MLSSAHLDRKSHTSPKLKGGESQKGFKKKKELREREREREMVERSGNVRNAQEKEKEKKTARET